MASPEALTKYYDCLKDSFNKIQVKDNKTALVNAALRPKIREELVKSRDVLISYLNYIQVFTQIYSDKFHSICFSVICPLFKEYPRKQSEANQDDHEDGQSRIEVSSLVHSSIREILKSKPELVEDFVHCVVKFFPYCYNDDLATFMNYFENSLDICCYIRGEPLTVLLAKMLDRINPPASKEQNDQDKIAQSKKCIASAYELIYKRLESMERRQLENVSAAILAAFSREFLTSENGDDLNYLIFHICSLDHKLTDLFINLLWAVFTNCNRPIDERRASAYYACSFMSRASYVNLEKVLNYLENAVIWCKNYLFENQSNDIKSKPDTSERFHETNQLFYSLVDSILYILTQRYRELYEKESIEQLKNFDLDEILFSQLRPLEVCDMDTEQRFREVASLIGISRLKPIDKAASSKKKRKSDHNQSSRKTYKMPFDEANSSVPDHIKHLYRNYYNHRNFTIYRE